MDRRDFVEKGAATLCVMPFLGWTSFMNADPTKPTWLVELIKLNDANVKGAAKHKITDPAHPYFGGYFNDMGLANPHSNCGFLNMSCPAISSKESVYYQSKDLLNDIVLNLKSLLKLQHEDGTIDLMDTNFHSTPDTGFMTKQTAISYKLLKQSGTPGMEEALKLFQQFLQKTGEALIVGGIHTPNHRWVVSAALTKLNELWPDVRYVNRINEWLAEHIDLDADGQYTEKSTGGYSALVDRVLITIAKGNNRPDLLNAVRKNLEMMYYYIHPNGEVVTEASNRQDKGQISHLDGYYYAYRYMSLLDNNAEMAAACGLIEKTTPNSSLGILNYLLEDPFLWKTLPSPKALPINYVKSFPYSGLVRIRRQQWDATLLSNNPGWLTFHKGNAVLQGMRVASSFFGKGQFLSEQIKQVGNTWVLNKSLEGVYYQPFTKEFIREDGDLGKIPKSNRKQSNINYLDTTVTIAEAATGGITVEIDMKGTDRVPVSLELIFRKGGTFSGVKPHATNPDAFYFNESKGTYTLGTDSISFGPGKMDHLGTVLRGALPAMNANTVYITGITPFKHTLQIA